MSAELLPCPFCGCDPGWSGGPSTYVTCQKCGCDGPWNDDHDFDRAAELWNTRAQPINPSPAYSKSIMGQANVSVPRDALDMLLHKFERAGGPWAVAQKGIELGASSWASNIENSLIALEAALSATQARPDGRECRACGGTGEEDVQMKINDVENDTTTVACTACLGTGITPTQPLAPTPCPVCLGFCGDTGPTCSERHADGIHIGRYSSNPAARELLANDRLIAAAPELLDLVEIALDFITNRHTMSREAADRCAELFKEVAPKVIAKATGDDE